MNKPQNIALAGERITWHKGVGCIEVSDLGLGHFQLPHTVSVTSPRTGAVMVFTYTRTKMDWHHEEVVAYVYTCPLRNVELHVLND